MSVLHRAKPRLRRRSWPIIGFCGSNGGGKTMAAVWDSLPALEAGRHVASTVRLLDYTDPRPCDGNDCRIECEDHAEHGKAHPGWIPLDSWKALEEARGVDVILDEVTGVAGSRTSHALPAGIANILVQLRRRDVVLRWTAPAWARADLIIRECSQAVVYCQGRLPVDVEGTDRVWRRRRLALWDTYDAMEFEQFTVGKREAMKPLLRDWHWIPNSPAALAYDTYDAVLSLGDVTDAGTCTTCSGTRRRKQCTCADYVNDPERAPARRTRGVPAKRGDAEAAPTPATVAALADRHAPAPQLDAVSLAVAIPAGVNLRRTGAGR